ncbi:MAG TPA: transposase [Anaerolineales bacterium]|nr:transposase [Anaerolineales bacterium]
MPYWRLFYHVIWSTKNRLPLIDPAWEKDLHGYIRGKATALECIPYAIGGMPDHLHVAISIPPKLAVATLPWMGLGREPIQGFFTAGL